ncbi:hypothetical protein RVIR1_09180 [Candidatus Rickettsiella viridis]|uniref:Uncharacterized protein n=2 Tax=Candidatus Rickettsiella viridis TaxID=676208 RepID=A0A2Z5UV75_9COXI|nr:hypothetical protein RVIR1_09180 [Candidatus Rickettsiella viridis]
MVRSRVAYFWHLSLKYLERRRAALEKTIEHITSSEFWRLFALVGKRIISIAKTFSKLPFLFTPLLYALHFLRASLRVVNYFRKTKNKNLGETRKLLFSAFKMTMAITVFVLCFFMPVPAVLLTSFLLYSALKLLDSAGVFVFSVVAHFKIDENLPENRWRRAQYWDNIKKHMSILAPGIAMTLMTSILLAGSVAGIVWTSPVILLALAIASVVTAVSLAYVSGLIYSRQTSKTDDAKAAYHEGIKKFAKVFVPWLACCLLVGVSCALPTVPALGLISAFLVLFYLYDAVNSSYYYFKTKSDHPKLPADVITSNSLESHPLRCYYASKNPLFSLKKNTAVEANHIVLTKEALVYVHELKNKLYQLEKEKGLGFLLEKSKIEIKIKYIVYGLAKTLKNGENDSDYLMELLIKVKKEFDQDTDKLADKPLNLNTLQNINNINNFKKELDELIKYKQDCDVSIFNANNVLLALFFAYTDSESLNKQQPPPFFHQSFFRSTGRATLFWRTFEYCQNTQQVEKKELRLENNCLMR